MRARPLKSFLFQTAMGGFFGQVVELTEEVPAPGTRRCRSSTSVAGGGTWRADAIVLLPARPLSGFRERGEPRLLLKPEPRRKERAYVASVHARRTVGVVHDSSGRLIEGRRSRCWI